MATLPSSLEQTYHLQVAVLPQLGALDRVLGALTHRGIIPLSFTATLAADATTLLVEATFPHSDAHALTKLTQFLQKQVQVASVTLHPVTSATPN